MKNKWVFVLLINVLLTSCTFIEYVPTVPVNEEQIAFLNEEKEMYIDKINELYTIEGLDENEKKEIRKYLIEARSEIYESTNIETIKAIYTKNELLLASFYLNKYKLEEISKIKELLNNKVNRDILNLSEKLKTLEKDVSSASNNEAIDALTAAFKLEIYRNNAVVNIDNYINDDDYYEEELVKIRAIREYYVSRVLEGDNEEIIDELVLDYMVKVYSYETKEMIEEKEVTEAIKAALKDYSDTYYLYRYRDYEKGIVSALFDDFGKELESSSSLASVNYIKNKYSILLDAIKTKDELYEEEKTTLVEEQMYDIRKLVNYSELSIEDKAYYDTLEALMLSFDKKGDVLTKAYHEKALYLGTKASVGSHDDLVSFQLSSIEELKYYLDVSNYKQEQINEIDTIINAAQVAIMLCTNYETTVHTVDNYKEQLNTIKSIDDLCEDAANNYIILLESIYGPNILIPPDSLWEADSYEELASIIDYYAFYQLDADSFVQDTFKVKINWNHRDATYEKREVYWYSELLRFAVGFDVIIEDEDYLVITLIPYDIASIPNEVDEHKISNLTSFNSTQSFTPRESTFDDFKYKDIGVRTIECWNSQQLWYALEHDYIPLCAPGSKAEIVFTKAKDILREIIQEGMSDEQKLFEIYKWCGMNWVEDLTFFDNWNTSNIEEYPDEKYALVYSAMAEGGILTHGVVCAAATKAFLILLKIEGIECCRILCEHPSLFNENTINGRPYGTNGSHELLFVYLNDVWYCCDPLYSIEIVDTASFDRLLLPTSSIPWPTKMKKDLIIKKPINYDFYKKLSYNGISTFVTNANDLDNLLIVFFSNTDSSAINITYDSSQFDAYNYYLSKYDKACKHIKCYVDELVIYS